MYRIFISSVQAEFADERRLLKDYIEKSSLLRRFFSVFIFEADVPTSDKTTEAVVNAIAHRDYLSTGSVQVELFPDRLEIYNPGTVNPALPKEKLMVRHGSFPNNPLVAEPFSLQPLPSLKRFVTLMATC